MLEEIQTIDKPKVNLSPLNNVIDKRDVHVILLKVLNPSFKINGKPYNLKICGKTMVEWVKSACGDCPITEVEYSEEDDLLILIKSLMNLDFRYTVVLFSDTPLLQRATFKDIIDFVRLKNLTVAKLTRGYVFETAYLQTIDKLLAPQTYYFEEEDFMSCFNLKQYSLICDIMKNRILYYHMKNGVVIKDVSSTFIDADVLIGENVIVEPFNQILGNSKIGDEVILESGNVLDNAIVLNDAKITNSIITNSVVGANSIVNAFCRIENKCIIGNNCKIKSFTCLLDGKAVNDNTEN